MSEEKKGITVKIDAALHAEVRQYLEEHGMTMGEFIALAVDNELHPKMEMTEEKEMGKMRTLAFQVTEELFQKIKQYLLRNNMTQKEFVIGLIEAELDREQTEREVSAEEVKETAAKEAEEVSAEPDQSDELEESVEMEDDIEEPEEEDGIEEEEDIEEDDESEEAEDIEEDEESEEDDIEEEEEPEEAEDYAMGMSM